MGKPLPDVRVGDVWASKSGRNRVRVDAITAHRYTTSEVRWTSLTIKGLGSNSSGVCSIVNFPRGRRLVERDGKPVEGA